MAEQRLSQIADRLEKVAARLENIRSGPSGGGASNENTEIVEEFDKMVMERKLKKYFELSAKLGGDVQKIAALVRTCFDEQRKVIVLASKHKAPAADLLAKIVKPLGAAVDSVVSFAEKNRSSKQINHLFTIKDGIGCVGWVTVAPKPAPYVKQSFDSALFYGNRVLKEFKGKDDSQVDWMRAFTDAIKELEEYVRTFHTTGLAWNADGTPAVLPAAGGPPPPPGGAGPPPPPPPAVQPPSDVPAPSKPDRPDPAALFAQINKGAGITSGLKKVTNDMKTHKNPELRASSVVKASDSKPKATTTTAASKAVTQTKKPPVLELKGQKWMVENQENNSAIDITINNPKEAVFIYKCNKSTIKVSNKCNSILIDSCKRVGLVFEGVISAVEVINSQSVQIQSLGQCHTVSIDKTDGCQVYLSKDCIDAEIITAKSSEMNVLVPDKDGEFSEHAIPEQFRTKWNGTKLQTECTDING